MTKQELSDKMSLLEQRVTSLEMKISQSSGAPQRRMLTSEEAARFLGMTTDGLRGLTHKKLIPFYKPNGKNIYFDVDELVSWQRKHHFDPIGEALAGEN